MTDDEHKRAVAEALDAAEREWASAMLTDSVPRSREAFWVASGVLDGLRLDFGLPVPDRNR